MKIVTWNCAGALRRKLAALQGLEADLLVIQECENPGRPDGNGTAWRNYRDFAGDRFVWAGSNPNRGLAVFAPNGSALKKLRWRNGGLEAFLPVRIDDRFNLINVWTKDGGRPDKRYVGQLAHYLDAHGRKIRKSAHVICGDFNSHIQWDGKYKRNHSHVVAHLARLGLASVYHHQHDIHQGAEPEPTFYLYRNLAKPYHLDYGFLPGAWLGRNNVAVGAPADWLRLSDHMPLSFEVSFA